MAIDFSDDVQIPPFFIMKRQFGATMSEWEKSHLMYFSACVYKPTVYETGEKGICTFSARLMARL